MKKILLTLLCVCSFMFTSHAQSNVPRFDIWVDVPEDKKYNATQTSAECIEFYKYDDEIRSEIIISSGKCKLDIFEGCHYYIRTKMLGVISKGYEVDLPDGGFAAHAPKRIGAATTVAEPTLEGPALVIMRNNEDPDIHYFIEDTDTIKLVRDGKYYRVYHTSLIDSESVKDFNYPVSSVTSVYYMQPHTQIEAHPAKDPTCTTSGNYAYWYCKGCDRCFSDEECKTEISYSSCVIPPTGHDYDNGFCSVCHVRKSATVVTIDNFKSLGLTASNYSTYIGYYAIGSAGEMASFRDLVNTSTTKDGTTTYPNAKAKAVLTADIDLSPVCHPADAEQGVAAVNWTPIGTEDGPFMGTFDGQGYIISGLSILNYTTSNQGLFGHVQGEYVSGSSEKHAVLKNFSVCGTMTSKTSGLKHIGGVVGFSDYCVDLTDVTNYVNITLESGVKQSHVGGVAGFCSRTEMYHCVNNGNINAGASWDCVGGVQAYTTGFSSMKYCLNTGSITSSADDAYIGGILGYYNDGDNNRFSGCHYCLNTGSVKGGTENTYAGAIVGRYRHNAYKKSSNNYYLSGSSNKAVGEDESTDNISNACKSVSAANIASGEVCTNVDFHTYALNDRNHEQCTFCNHYFFHYSTTDNKAVTPNKPENILDADGNSFITNKYFAGESMCAMEFKAPLVTIGERAFEDCKSLSGTLTIPSTVTSIGASAFNYCENLSGTLAIPNSVSSIGRFAFAYCSKLMLVTLPNSITSIEPGLFYSCEKLEGDLTIPNTVTSIGDNAFNNCHNFNGTLTLSDHLTNIGKESFCTCHFNGTLNIPSTVTNIGASAFSNCTWFTRIMMNSIPKATNGIFSGCTPYITLALTDDSYVTTETGNYSPEFTSATYTRTGIKNQWGTLVLPFDVTIYDDAPYDFYTISSITSSTIFLTKLPGTLAAGTPVFIRMSEAAKDGDVYKDLQITKSMVSVTNTINTALASSASGLSLQGSYAVKDLTSGYIINNDMLWSVAELTGNGKTVKMAPFHAYLDTESYGAKLQIVVEEDATGIEAVSSFKSQVSGKYLENGRVIIVRNGKKYNVNGQEVK